MGPFQEYEEKKSPEKGSPRSRIPRLVLQPFQPKEKGSPLSESPLSEEDGVSSDHSKRTISTNSFCSDDTGCPTSQSVSPSKTPAGSDHSPQASPPPHASPQPSNRRPKGKRVRMMAEKDPERAPPLRNKRSSTQPKGSEADFSSSSSAGSLKTRELLGHCSSTGKKASSRRVGAHIRSFPVFRPAGSPTANRDAELYAPYRTPPKAPPTSSTNSSCNNSPSSRRASLGRYHSCGDNHGIHAPQPEQYLTPLQQKEVAIRHLKSKLRESENTVHDRETEIEDLKGQLGRMREDWIEEECHRVEAQLSLKEARKEIKQLRQVVETMRSSLMEKDKGIHKYFIDINIQNRKLESLLHSMELAQSGSGSTLDICDGSSPDQIPSPDQSSGRGEERGSGAGGLGVGGLGTGTLETGTGLLEEDQGGEEMADSGLLASEELVSHAEALEQVLMSTAMDTSKPGARLGAGLGAGLSTLLLHSGGEEEEEEEEEKEKQQEEKTTPPNPPAATASSCPSPPSPRSEARPEEKGVQTELLSIPPELKALLLQLLKLPGGETLLPASSGLLGVPAPALPPTPTPSPALCCLEPMEAPSCSPQVPKPPRFMPELDFCTSEGEESCGAPGAGVVGERHWSSSFLVDLAAVAAPILPTVAWLYARHGVDGGGAPMYNIGALMRGCCVMGLRSLRRAAEA